MARPKKEKKINICKFPSCGKSFETIPSLIRDFCSKSCAQKYKAEYNPECWEKRKKTCLEKYGDEVAFRSKQVQDKYKNNLIKKYGVDNPFLVPEFKEKSDKTILKKYGTKVANMNKEIGNKISDSLKNKPKNRINFVEVKWEKILNYCNEVNMTPLFTKEELLNNKLQHQYDNKFKFICNNCNNTTVVSLSNGYFPSCDCSNYKGYSLIEEEIYLYIKSIINDTILLKNRDILPNRLELDIFIPNRNIAIEINGIYWHSESMGKYKDYHIYKTEKCEEKNIQLIHIFDNEWIYKKPIIQSIIKSKLGVIDDKIYARKCIIKEINDNIILKDFLNNNHIQGYCYSNINYGLYYQDELVAVMTFGKNRFKKNSNEYELIRYCSKLNTNIVGGASKLLKHFKNNYKNNILITFADRRFSQGNLYKQLGFKFENYTSPSYFYWKNNTILKRMSCQKHKLHKFLPIYDKSLSEYKNMIANGFRRVWDCGNIKYSLSF